MQLVMAELVLNQGLLFSSSASTSGGELGRAGLEWSSSAGLVSRGPRGGARDGAQEARRGGKWGREEDSRERSMWGRVGDCGVALGGGVEMRPVVREAQI